MSELAKIRRSKGFSQRSLAEAANVSPSSIYEIENGRRKANPSTLRKLADALGVEIADLLEEDERPKVTAPPSLAEWLEERCGHSYLALSQEEIQALVDDAEHDDRRILVGLMRQELRMISEERRKYPAGEKVLIGGERYTDIMRRYLLAVFTGSSLTREEAEEEAQEFTSIVS